MTKPQKYKVVLSEKDRAILQKISTKGRTSARIFKRAQILLKADQSLGHVLKDEEIASMLEISKSTVQNI